MKEDEIFKPVSKKNRLQLPWLPVAVFSLGILSVLLIVAAYRIGVQRQQNYLLTDALHVIQTDLTRSHLWLEEYAHSDRDVDMERVWGSVEHSIALTNAMQQGGFTLHGYMLQPMPDDQTRKDVQQLRSLLLQYKGLAVRKFHEGTGSEADQALNRHYKKIIDHADELDDKFAKIQTKYGVQSNNLFMAMTLAWSLILMSAVAGLWYREQQRKTAEDELKTYQDQLEDIVEARTAELAAAVTSLNEEVREHLETSAALRASEEQFRQLSQEFNVLLDAIPDCLVLMAHDLKIKWANSEAVKNFAQNNKIPASEQYCYSLWHNADTPCADCPVLKSFQTGRPETARIKTPDGRLWASRAYPIRDEQGIISSVMEINTDITEKTVLHAERMRASHLASIGELAAGVAHEINNPINGIINYAQILLNSAVRENKEHDIAQKIITEGERIAIIVKSLLSFARERKEEKVPVRIEEVFKDAFALAEIQMRKSGIDLKIDFPPNLPMVNAHAQQLQQVFLNIINNARYALNMKYPQASPDKIFRITGKSITMEGREFVRIVFEDHGSGISKQVLDKVMTPFFTTKPVGIGTGLGLSISHGIIIDHGGKIDIESIEGEYTRVNISLPSREEQT